MVCCNWDGGVLKEGLRLPCFGGWVSRIGSPIYVCRHMYPYGMI